MKDIKLHLITLLTLQSLTFEIGVFCAAELGLCITQETMFLLRSSRCYGGLTGVDFLLIEAVNSGDINRVERALVLGASLDAPCDYDGHGNAIAPLIKAAELRQLDVVRLLLEAAADPNISHHYTRLPISQTTALMHAALDGDNRMVQLLIGAGADLNAQNADGNTALSFAVYHDCVAGGGCEITQILVDAGADLDVRVGGAHNVLSFAMGRHNDAILDLLYKAGADFSGLKSSSLLYKLSLLEQGKVFNDIEWMMWREAESRAQERARARAQEREQDRVRECEQEEEKEGEEDSEIAVFVAIKKELGAGNISKVAQRKMIVAEAQQRQAARARDQKRRAQMVRDAQKIKEASLLSHKKAFPYQLFFDLVSAQNKAQAAQVIADNRNADTENFNPDIASALAASHTGVSLKRASAFFRDSVQLVLM